MSPAHVVDEIARQTAEAPQTAFQPPRVVWFARPAS